MRKELVLPLAAAFAVAAFAVAPSADAHTLLPREAANSAWLAASDWGDARESRYGDVMDVDVAREDCHRRSRHVRSCDAIVDFEKEVRRRECDYYSGIGLECYWETDYESTNCSLTVRVRLTGYSTRERVRKDWCV